MGILKNLNYHLGDLLKAMPHEYCVSLLHEEFLCCCERAQLAIKDFTQEEDSKLYHCFPTAGDALCDLQWCSHTLQWDVWNPRLFHVVSDIAKVLLPLMWEFNRFQKYKPRGLNRRPSVYCSDGRKSSGSAHLPPGLNVDDVGEIKYVDDLGEGSQGMVYKARWRNVDGTSDLGFSDYIHEPFGDLVAVKEVSSGARSEAMETVGGDLVSRSDLYCELDVLKKLRHPNIVELKGYTRKVRTQGKYGLVMELMSSSLADFLKSQTSLSDLVKVDTLLQVARGMHYLHTLRIMHRDLKPGNILIRELTYLPWNVRRLGYVVAKLADFGLSKQEDLATYGAGCHTEWKGTSFYMAPELRENCNGAVQYGLSADVFSFGTTCFNVLTGEKIPFGREGRPLKSEEFYYMIKWESDLFKINCGRSKMSDLVRQCWCFDPSKRPTFLQICQILEDEKRQILCRATPISRRSKWINQIEKASVK